MPLPKPQSGESQDNFIDRCMSDETMKDEYTNNDQRLAVCNGLWSDRTMKRKHISKKEVRVFKMQEIRVKSADDDGPATISGYAAVFDSMSEDMGFREFISPGAFTKALKKSDARALFNHDSNIVLGRQSSGTLKLKEDKQGLHMEVEPPDTQLVRDMVLAPMERGDIKEQSFGFTVKTDEWTEDRKTGVVTRNIKEVDEVFDVSPVTFPAYPDTTVAIRSMEEFRKTGGATAADDDATVENENMEIRLLTSKVGGYVK